MPNIDATCFKYVDMVWDGQPDHHQSKITCCNMFSGFVCLCQRLHCVDFVCQNTAESGSSRVGNSGMVSRVYFSWRFSEYIHHLDKNINNQKSTFKGICIDRLTACTSAFKPLCPDFGLCGCLWRQSCSISRIQSLPHVTTDNGLQLLPNNNYQSRLYRDLWTI